MPNEPLDRDAGPDADPEAFLIKYRNFISIRAKGIMDEQTRAKFDAEIPDMRARWKAWSGADDLYEKAFSTSLE
jgi:hypothetical protein